MQDYFRRSQPPISIKSTVIAGVGGAIAILAVSISSKLFGSAMLMAPFGASCVLLFSASASPFSQPANVIFGHVLSALVGFAFLLLFPGCWWAAALSVGVAISLMTALRVTHPPAGANPLVIFAAEPGLDFLLFPVASGAVILVFVAIAFHKFSSLQYPVRPK